MSYQEQLRKYLKEQYEACIDQTGCLPEVEDWECLVECEEFQKRFPGIMCIRDLFNTLVEAF